MGEYLFLKSHISCVSPSGDLTENQKKIFKANQFYRGLAIPEPQETVGGVLKLGRGHTSQGLYSLSLPPWKKEMQTIFRKIKASMLWSIP